MDNSKLSIEEAIRELNRLVGWAESSTEIKRLDFNRVPAAERAHYEEALRVVTEAIKAGQLTRDEFIRKVGIDH